MLINIEANTNSPLQFFQYFQVSAGTLSNIAGGLDTEASDIEGKLECAASVVKNATIDALTPDEKTAVDNFQNSLAAFQANETVE